MVNKKKLKQIELTLKTSLYPLEAICGAAYVFIDRAYIYLDQAKEGEIEIKIKGKEDSGEKEQEKLEGEFMNELLNYVQRLNISKHTKKIREYVVERALYSSVNENDLGDDNLEFDDPLGIAIPWEEKYGDQKDEK